LTTVTMSQEEINKDLGHYLHDKKTQPFWSNMFREKQEVRNEIKEELEHTDDHMNPEDKKELEHIEQKIEEVDKIGEEVEETIEKEKEGLLTKFFKKLRSTRTAPEMDEEEMASTVESGDEEMKQFLKTMHRWITQLPPEKQQEFKSSEDFKVYTDMLRKYNLIKE